MFNTIFADGSLRDFINNNIADPWIGTPFEGYVHMSPKQQGEFGERFTHSMMQFRGSVVKRAATSTAGHDRVIDDFLTEIKFSLACRNSKDKSQVVEDKFIINHVAACKDWQRLIFVGINKDEENARIVWFSKEDFLAHMKSEDCLFKHQQSGKKGGNDDYICTNVKALLQCSFVKSIELW